MSSQPAGQLVGELVGAYKLVRILGEGGMGTVYEGLHPTLGRRAAIKVLHLEHSQNSDILSRFFNEARAVNIVEHPSLVNIYEYGTTPAGVAYIVMEYLAGESLRSRQRRIGGRMGLAALPIARQVANALAATHEKQIVHRDLKPDNIMLVPDAELNEGERAKILDFGIAKLAGDGGAEALKVKTKTGAMLGTPTYMSPEQCRGVGTIDGRTDVYALGVILFELLSGQPPFVSDGFGDLIGMHMFKAPPDLAPLAPKTPRELLKLVERMLAKEPTARPSMAETAATLTRIGRSVSPTALAMPPLSAATSHSGAGAVSQNANTTIGNATGQSALAVAGPRQRTLKRAAVAGAAVLAVGLVALWFQLHESRLRSGAHPPGSEHSRPAASVEPVIPSVSTAKADPGTPATPGRPTESLTATPTAAVTRASPAVARSTAPSPAARCQTLFKRGRYADAVTACTVALSSDPAQPEVQRTLRAAQDAVAATKSPAPAATPATAPRHYEKVKALD